MSEPFLGEIKMFGFSFAPRDWALCNGQVMDIGQNSSLYSLIDVQFGGNGVSNFKLPDFRGRIPIHPGQAYQGAAQVFQGQYGGLEQVALAENQLPSHTHQMYAQSTDSNVSVATGAFLSKVKSVSGSSSYSKDPTPIYTDNINDTVPLDTKSISKTGGNQAHYNIQPSLVMNFCIALRGLYPSRS